MPYPPSICSTVWWKRSLNKIFKSIQIIIYPIEILQTCNVSSSLLATALSPHSIST